MLCSVAVGKLCFGACFFCDDAVPCFLIFYIVALCLVLSCFSTGRDGAGFDGLGLFWAILSLIEPVKIDYRFKVIVFIPSCF